MSPPRPGPGAALDRLVETCDAGVDALLAALPVVGDRETQRAVERMLDHTMDTLRMLAALGRETRAVLPPAGETADRPAPAGPARRSVR